LHFFIRNGSSIRIVLHVLNSEVQAIFNFFLSASILLAVSHKLPGPLREDFSSAILATLAQTSCAPMLILSSLLNWVLNASLAVLHAVRFLSSVSVVSSFLHLSLMLVSPRQASNAATYAFISLPSLVFSEQVALSPRPRVFTITSLVRSNSGCFFSFFSIIVAAFSALVDCRK